MSFLSYLVLFVTLFYIVACDEAASNVTTLNENEEIEVEHPLVTSSRKLFLVVIPIITVLGVVGNSLMLVVMCQPRQRESPVSVYMSALAISDTIVLILDFINNWINFVSSVHLKSSSEEFCQFYNFLFNTSYTYCAWLVVFVSIERLIVVWFPLKAKSWSTVRNARITVCVLVIPCAALHSFNFLIWKINEDGACDLDDQYKYFNQNVQAWMSAVFYSYLPVVILIVSSGFNIRKLVQAKSYMKSIGAEKVEIYKATFTVVLVCVFYILLTVPLTVFYGIIFYLDQYIQRSPEIDLTRTIILILGLSNHAINFFLYVLSSVKFRKQLRDICCCGRASAKDYSLSGSHISTEPSTITMPAGLTTHI